MTTAIAAAKPCAIAGAGPTTDQIANVTIAQPRGTEIYAVGAEKAGKTLKNQAVAWR